MPRYYFNLLVEDRCIPDPEGQELDSLADARNVAKLSLCEIASARLQAGQNVDLDAIDIASAEGTILAQVTTEDAVLLRFSAFRRLQKQLE